MRISEKAIQKIMNDNYVKSELVRVSGKSYSTIHRWIATNDERLTQKNCVEVIKAHTGLTENEIFENEEAVNS